jgi:hypothetical protein
MTNNYDGSKGAAYDINLLNAIFHSFLIDTTDGKKHGILERENSFSS